MSQGRKAYGPTKKVKADLRHFVKAHKDKGHRIAIGEFGSPKSLEQKLKKPRQPN